MYDSKSSLLRIGVIKLYYGGGQTLLATVDYATLLEKTDKLTKMILQSDVIDEYKSARKQLQNDEEAQKLIAKFQRCKEEYEEVERFGRYHPDYQQIMKNIRRTKRKMDMHESVARFKVAERKVQRFLDEISEYLAKSVSDQIIVPKDELDHNTGCSSSGCGSGGSCGCKVS